MDPRAPQSTCLQGEQGLVSRDLVSLIELEPWAHVREEASIENHPGGQRSIQIVRTNKGVNKGISLTMWGWGRT